MGGSDLELKCLFYPCFIRLCSSHGFAVIFTYLTLPASCCTSCCYMAYHAVQNPWAAFLSQPHPFVRDSVITEAHVQGKAPSGLKPPTPSSSYNHVLCLLLSMSLSLSLLLFLPFPNLGDRGCFDVSSRESVQFFFTSWSSFCISPLSLCTFVYSQIFLPNANPINCLVNLSLLWYFRKLSSFRILLEYCH